MDVFSLEEEEYGDLFLTQRQSEGSGQNSGENVDETGEGRSDENMLYEDISDAETEEKEESVPTFE